MEKLNELIAQLIEVYEVELLEENVAFVFNDSCLVLSLEDNNLQVNVSFADRIIRLDYDLNGKVELL